MKWQPIETAPNNLMVIATNNLHATNANGQMSHLWITYIFTDDSLPVEYCGFDEGKRKILGLTHWMPLPEPPEASND